VSFIDTNELSVKEPRPGWKGRFFHSEHMTFAYYTVARGAWVHEHSHSNDEVWNVVEGRPEVTILERGALREGPHQSASHYCGLPTASLDRWCRPLSPV
jgi:hypothetical protein